MKTTLPDMLRKIEKVRSMSEGRRLILSGFVSVNGNRIEDISLEMDFKVGDVIKIGKSEIVVPELE